MNVKLYTLTTNISRKHLDMNRLWKFFKPVLATSISIITLIFSFTPESVYTHGVVEVDYSTESIVICNRLLLLLLIVVIASILNLIRWNRRKSTTIKGNGYKIEVEYCNIFEKTDCKKVINFDECYTTHIGTNTEDIKAGSICGQFLQKFSEVDFKSIVQSSDLKPMRKHSEYNAQECYELGSIVPYNDYLLLAFAKLNIDGLGILTREEYLICLDVMWRNINKYYSGYNVAIPILGSGITRFQGEPLSQQQLLDMIIASYKLTPYKLGNRAKLHIVCRKDDDFSLNKIGEYI